MIECHYCDQPADNCKYIGVDGNRLCEECARREILGMIQDRNSDELREMIVAAFIEGEFKI